MSARLRASAGQPTVLVLLPLLLLSLLLHQLACSASSPPSIYFGMSGPFSGSNSFLGLNTFAGINAAFARSNRLAALPVNLSLVALDDGYDPSVALSNIQQLATDYKLLGVLGAVGTPTVTNILPYLTNFSIPLYGPVTGVRSLRHPFVSNVVNVRASYDDECEAIVRLCLELGRLRISIFYQNDGFGQAGLSGLQLALAARGLAILSEASYVRNTLDVQTGLQQLLVDIVPQAVLCVGVGPACGAFINAAVSSNSSWCDEDIAYFALSFVAAESLAAALLPSSLAPVYVSQVVPLPYPSNRSTAAASLANEYNAELLLSCPTCTSSFAGLEGYMAGKLVSSALQFNPDLVMQWLAQPASLVSVDSSTMPVRLAFANAVLEQGMLPAGGTVRQGPYGPACTGDEYDGLGYCGCNQGSHIVFLTQLDQASSTFVDLPDSVYTFVDCGTAILEPVLLANTPIIFGQSAALTGPYSTVGAELARGIRAAFNEYNEANLNTRRNLLLVSYDDRADTNLTVTNARDLIQRQQIFALVGTDSDEATTAQLDLAVAAGVPLIGPLSGYQALRTDVDSVVNLRASFDDECAAVIASMVSSQHCRAIGLLIGQTDVDDAVLAAVTMALGYHRRQAARVMRYETTAVAGALELLAANATIDCLYVNGAAGDAAAAIVQLKHSDHSPTSFYVNDHVGPELLVAGLAGEYDGVWMSQAMPSPYTSTADPSQAASPFVAAYRAALASLFPADSHVSYASIEGYLIGRLIAAAMTSDPEQTPDSWLSELYSLGPLSLDGLVVGPYQRTGNTDVSELTVASTSTSAASTVQCDQGYAAVTMTSISSVGQFVQETVYSVPSMIMQPSQSEGPLPLVTGVGSSGVCGVSSAYSDPACPANSQKVYSSTASTAYQCMLCATGQTADGSTSPCEYPMDSTPAGSAAVLTVLSALFIALTLIVVVAVYALRKRAVFRAASPLFLILILVGVLLALTAVILLCQSPSTSALCKAGTVLGHLSYALSIGALVVKSYRLAAIFNQRRVKVLKISDRQLALVLGTVLVALSVYLLVWLTVDPPLATLVVDLSTESQTLLCRSQSSAWSIVLVSVEGLLMLYGMSIAYRCRHNPEAFNETRYIAVILYNCAVIGAASVGVLYAVTLSSFATAVLECASLLVVAFTLVAVLFGPKFYQLYAGKPDQITDMQQQQQHSHHSSQAVRVQVKGQLVASPYGSPSSLDTGSRSLAAHSTVAPERGWMEAPLKLAAAGVARERDTADTEPVARGGEHRMGAEEVRQQQQPQQAQSVRSPKSSSSHSSRATPAQRISSLVAVNDADENESS